MKKSIVFLTAAILASALALTGCGGDDKSKDASAESSSGKTEESSKDKASGSEQSSGAKKEKSSEQSKKSSDSKEGKSQASTSNKGVAKAAVTVEPTLPKEVRVTDDRYADGDAQTPDSPAEVPQAPRPETRPSLPKTEPTEKKAEEPKAEKQPEKKPEKKVVYTTKDVTTTEPVAYETARREDPDTAEGETYVIQKGAAGTRAITTRIYYADGVETKREVISDTVTKAPVNEIIGVGTKKAEAKYYYAQQIDANTYFFSSEDEAIAWAENVRATIQLENGDDNPNNLMIIHDYSGYAGGDYTYDGVYGFIIQWYK